MYNRTLYVPSTRAALKSMWRWPEGTIFVVTLNLLTQIHIHKHIQKFKFLILEGFWYFKFLT